MGSPVDDCNFLAMIMNFITDSFQTLLHTTTTVTHASGHISMSSTIISVIFREVDHCNIRKDVSATTDAALNASAKSGCCKCRSKTPTGLALAAIVSVISQTIIGKRGDKGKARGLIRS